MGLKHAAARTATVPPTSVALPKPGKKYFTVEEASRALRYVSPVVSDVTETYRTIVSLRRQLEGLPVGLIDLAAAEMEREYDRAMERLSQLIDELHDVGVELKDFEQGLIDFPAIHDGREVLLCWHSGEDRIAHWHEIDAGFAGRRCVSLLRPPSVAA